MRWGDLNEHTLTESVWNKIDMYSTFRDYYNNVLSHEIIRKNDAPKLVKKIKATKED